MSEDDDDNEDEDGDDEYESRSSKNDEDENDDGSKDGTDNINRDSLVESSISNIEETNNQKEHGLDRNTKSSRLK